jgi:hypothetical protein
VGNVTVLPTLSKILDKYRDLMDGYDSKRYYVNYFGLVHLLIEKNMDGELIFEVGIRTKEKTKLARFAQLVNELCNEEVLKEAEEILSKPE